MLFWFALFLSIARGKSDYHPATKIRLFGRSEGLSARLVDSATEPAASSCAPSTKVFRNYTYHYGNYTAKLVEAARLRGYRNERKSPRFRNFMCKLLSGKPTNVVLFGGSVSNGNGLKHQVEMRFSKQLERWLQTEFPVKQEPGKPKQEHRVLNKAVGATDSCFLARTLPMRMANTGDMMQGADGTLGSFEKADLVILEFGVNDLQSALGLNTLPRNLYEMLQSDVLACMEAVVQQLLNAKDELAILFFEYTSGKLWDAVTAEAVHELIADRYGLPLVSYRKSVFPEIANGTHISNCHFKDSEYGTPYPMDESIRGHIDCNNRFKYFQKDGFGALQLDGTHPSPVGHKLATDLLAYAFQVEAEAMDKAVTAVPETTTPYSELFSAKQPKIEGFWQEAKSQPFLMFKNSNAIGGFTETWDTAGILRDAVARVDLPQVKLLGIATIAEECMEMCAKYTEAVCYSAVWADLNSEWPNLDQGQCYGRFDQVWAPASHAGVNSYRRSDIDWPMIPGGYAAVQKKIAELAGAKLVLTANSWGQGLFTIAQGARREWFKVEASPGWKYTFDIENKFGWICESPEAGEAIKFTINYKLFREHHDTINKGASNTKGGLIVWTLAFLASYEGMGKFDSAISCTGAPEKTLEIDGQWSKTVSVYEERELNAESTADACTITVTSQAQVSGRKGNKIKILGLAVNSRAAG
jgi:lysophospholipase L1-like esterase